MEPDREQVHGIDSWHPARFDRERAYDHFMVLDQGTRNKTLRRWCISIAIALALVVVYWIFS